FKATSNLAVRLAGAALSPDTTTHLVGDDPRPADRLLARLRAALLHDCECCLGALTDDPAFPLRDRREHVCDQLALDGAEIDAQVEGDDVVTVLTGILEQGGEVDHAPAEPVDLRRDDPICFMAPAGFERSLEPRPVLRGPARLDVLLYVKQRPAAVRTLALD